MTETRCLPALIRWSCVKDEPRRLMERTARIQLLVGGCSAPMRETTEARIDEAATAGVANRKIHFWLPQPRKANTTEAINRRFARKSNATRSTGWCCQNEKTLSCIESLSAWSRRVQIQTTALPAVNNQRDISRERPPRLRTPSSRSGSTNIQLGKTAMAPVIEASQRKMKTTRYKKVFPGNSTADYPFYAGDIL